MEEELPSALRAKKVSPYPVVPQRVAVGSRVVDASEDGEEVEQTMRDEYADRPELPADKETPQNVKEAFNYKQYASYWNDKGEKQKETMVIHHATPVRILLLGLKLSLGLTPKTRKIGI